MPRARNPLYLMAKPTVDAAAAIFDLSRCDRRRRRELLHMSLLAFVDLAEVPPSFLSILCKLLKGFEAPAFHVAFDRIEERRAVTLRSSAPLAAVRRFQTEFTDYLKAAGFPFFGSPPEPHVTINYRSDGKGTEEIHPVGWKVEEVLLIESVVGQARHIPHHRLALTPQG
jgi:2'-5' RNA ligase